VLIDHRPAVVADRNRCGDWEGDLIVGSGSRLAIGTLVERASRYLLLVHLPTNRSAEAMRDALIDTLSQLPEPAVIHRPPTPTRCPIGQQRLHSSVKS
jgi:IS30 family transposase